jgi:enoyl-CoA hydratase
MNYEFYSVNKEGFIGWVLLNRPQKKNAMNPPAWYELPRIISELDADDSVRVIIIASSGDTFCAGIDLLEMTQYISEIGEPQQRGGVKRSLIKKIYRLQETVNCLQKTDKPVIAAVNGYCIGAGLDLISACDIRLCSRDARFSLKEASVGFVADLGVLQRLPLIVGEGITRELAFTARLIDAETAYRIHLVNRVLNDKEELLKEAEALAEEIAQNSPLAVYNEKRVLNFISEERIRRGLEYVASISANTIPSDDLFEAFNAFMEKRRPDFKGK